MTSCCLYYFRLCVAAWVDSWAVSQLGNAEGFVVNRLGDKLQECGGLISI